MQLSCVIITKYLFQILATGFNILDELSMKFGIGESGVKWEVTLDFFSFLILNTGKVTISGRAGNSKF